VMPLGSLISDAQKKAPASVAGEQAPMPVNGSCDVVMVH